MDLEGQAYVPVFSSEEQFRQVVGAHMSYTVAPAVEFARGLPPQVGIAVNPDGTVGVPLPPPAVAELCRAGRTPLDGPAGGGRVRLYEPDWQDDPVDFLAAASAEFDGHRRGPHRPPLPGRRSRRRDPVMFVGVELSTGSGGPHALPLDALGQGPGPRRPPPGRSTWSSWTSPRTRWATGCGSKVRPFYQHGG